MESKSLSIGQVVKMTGLPASTIRYYDQQLGEHLEIRRGKGRRRDFSPQSLELLQKIHYWLKDEGLSLRQVRMRLENNTASGSGMEQLNVEVEALRREVNELKEIQKRMLDILSAMGG